MRRYRSAPDPRALFPWLLGFALSSASPTSRSRGRSFREGIAASPLRRCQSAVSAPAQAGRPTEPATPRKARVPKAGLWTFRGNARRNLTGVGPVPRRSPRIVWRYPRTGGMCSGSTDETGTSTWCGIGWTGQPNVIPRPRASSSSASAPSTAATTSWTPRAARGATVAAHRRPRQGLRDVRPRRVPALLRGLARQQPADRRARPRAADRPLGARQLRGRAGHMERRLGRRAARRRGAPPRRRRELVVLRRPAEPRLRPARQGARPARVVARVPSWDGRLLAARSDRAFSIESSVAYDRGIAYFANSAGLVQGWDVRPTFRHGKAPAASSASGWATTPTPRS